MQWIQRKPGAVVDLDQPTFGRSQCIFRSPPARCCRTYATPIGAARRGDRGYQVAEAGDQVARTCRPLQKRAGTVIVSPVTSTIPCSTRKTSAASADSGVSCFDGTGSVVWKVLRVEG